MTTALEEGEGSASRPGRSLPPGKTRYSLYRRLGGSQGRYGQVRKISPSPGFDPRTVQPVASRYTDWTTWPTHLIMNPINFLTSFYFLASWNFRLNYPHARIQPIFGCPRMIIRYIRSWFPSLVVVCSIRKVTTRHGLAPNNMHCGDLVTRLSCDTKALAFLL